MPEKYSVTSVLNAWVGICDIISGYLCEEGGEGGMQLMLSKLKFLSLIPDYCPG